jgi:hypothetical protein
MNDIDCRSININLQRLYHHPGFPNGERLSCPIFQQDKFNHIRSIPLESIPTLKIEFESEGLPEFSESEIFEVNRFMDAFDEGRGWHVSPRLQLMEKVYTAFSLTPSATLQAK